MVGLGRGAAQCGCGAGSLLTTEPAPAHGSPERAWPTRVPAWHPKAISSCRLHVATRLAHRAVVASRIERAVVASRIERLSASDACASGLRSGPTASARAVTAYTRSYIQRTPARSGDWSPSRLSKTPGPSILCALCRGPILAARVPPNRSPRQRRGSLGNNDVQASHLGWQPANIVAGGLRP